ncbi:MAG: ABC transporter permease [Candidatus Tritonobacter lacicola]|nr:ABC transporter permease [Candidatus Tritonobacter lacicola]
MKKLTLKAFRDLKAMKLRGLMIVLIIACQAAIYSGGLCSKLTLSRSVDDFCNNHNLADLQVTFDVTTADRLPALDDVKGIRKVESRLALDGSIKLEDNTTIPAVIIFMRDGENPAIDTLDIEDGVFPSKGDLGVVIERGLKDKGYTVGDKITVSAYDFTSTQPIVGIARSPEFLVSTANPEMLIPTPGSLGIIYAPVECVEKEIKKLSRVLRGSDPVNQLLFLYDDSALRQARDLRHDSDLQKRILARLSGAKKKLRIKKVVSRNEQFGIKFLQQDLKMFRVVVLAIVVIFSVVTLIVTGISVNRVVMSQRREIGALMAFGYRSGAIMKSCFLLGFLMGLAGGLVGAAASPAVNYLLAETYASAISLPPITLAFTAGILIEGVVIGILVASVAAVVPVIKLVRLTPVQAMRGGTDGAVQRVAVLARVAGALTGALSRSLPQRAAARNLFRRLKLTAATILLIALGLGITAGFVITLSSVLKSSAALLQRNKWDMIADFTEPQSGKKGLALCKEAGLVDPELFVKGYASISIRGRIADYQFVGMPSDSTLQSLRLTEGKGFSANDADEIIFNASFSDCAPPSPGDTVVVTSRGREHRLTVAGLISSLSTGQAYVPLETARRILGLEAECSGFMAKLDGTGAAGAKERLYASDLVSRVTVRSKLESVIEQQLAKATNLIALAVVIGAVVTLAIVINTMSMNILEREGEFATLMSLGYGRLPLARMVITEVFAMGIAALVLAVPIAVGIARYMNAELSHVWFHIDTYVTLKDFEMTLLLPFLLLPLAAVPALRHVFRLNIALVVREHVIE